MKLEIDISGRTRAVEITRAGKRFHFALDSQPVEADAVEVASGVYSLLLGGHSFEVRVEQAAEPGIRILIAGREFAVDVRDPRGWRRRRGASQEAEGRQQVVAPMPGKVVRLLVKQGDTVEAGQGLLVVEAMKMQNEIRAPKSGKVERLVVSEGQAVNAGEVLGVVA